jgi:hypothetical protein
MVVVSGDLDNVATAPGRVPASLTALSVEQYRSGLASLSFPCWLRQMPSRFASPLSSKGNLPCLLPPLLESFYAMHSSQREAKLLLPPAVGLSLTLLYLSQPSITIFTPILKKMY